MGGINMVLGTGLEPSIASLRGGLPNHLEEPSIFGRDMGNRTPASGLKGQRLSHLDYAPVDLGTLTPPKWRSMFVELFRATPFYQPSAQLPRVNRLRRSSSKTLRRHSISGMRSIKRF